uniref:SAM-dependent methyltransferase n=1 Tax=Polynucleobacter arcticus TaxID=1743165 RepID=A0A6M9PQP5_9BURK|nr:class I SAM-dependent methyltransferase [Polynucleobacter arcticus]QKM60166.1 SAM-dependent methyltransferase [Polynucleobacter arcticus]
MSNLHNLLDKFKLISQKNITHYDQNAVSYDEGTQGHDVSQNIHALLRAIQTEPPFQILDFGCGPGRDMQTLTKLGHIVTGLEGSQQAAQIARTKSGCEVMVQDFFNLNLPENTFDGIFANASLFHVPNHLLPKVLGDLRASLKPNGILFSSNPRGNNQESWYGDRFGSYHDLEGWRSFMTNAKFTEVEHYYRPSGVPFEQQPWLASVWRK